MADPYTIYFLGSIIVVAVLVSVLMTRKNRTDMNALATAKGEWRLVPSEGRFLVLERRDTDGTFRPVSQFVADWQHAHAIIQEIKRMEK